MERQLREFKPWWSSPEEERLALDELHAALVEQDNDKDYERRLDIYVEKLVDKIGSNENFQMIIQGIHRSPVFIGENSHTQDDLLKELEKYDEKEKEEAMRGGNYNSKKTKMKGTYGSTSTAPFYTFSHSKRPQSGRK